VNVDDDSVVVLPMLLDGVRLPVYVKTRRNVQRHECVQYNHGWVQATCSALWGTLPYSQFKQSRDYRLNFFTKVICAFCSSSFLTNFGLELNFYGWYKSVTKNITVFIKMSYL